MPLTYCLNVHPGESWAENFAALHTIVPAVRDMVAPGRPFGLGMRLSARAAAELDTPDQMDALRDLLARQNFFVFTINGFPHGRFHGPGVKENVYAPDWRTPERRDYTNRLATILAALLPEGGTGTISTVPGSWKPWISGAGDIEAMHAHLLGCADHCERLASKTGREIQIALEPEPGCLLETTRETIGFLQHPALDRARGRLGVCLDTCHAALQYEDPIACLRAYESAGISVPKIQISSALRTDASPAALEALRHFDEPVYMHQTRARMPDGIHSWNDLPEALAALPGTGAQEVRVHFHLPLHFSGNGLLRSTSELITREFLDAVQGRHLEIETYTWEILPAPLREGGIARGIAAEFHWLAQRSGTRL